MASLALLGAILLVSVGPTEAARVASYPKFRAEKDDGSPAVGWKLYTYAAGTTTPLATYADQAGASTNTNPVIMDGRGEASVFLLPTSAYKFVLTDESDVSVWTQDGIQTPDSGQFSSLTVTGTSTLAGVTATTVSASGQVTSTLATGSAPFVIASTTKVANLNVDKLDDGDWAAPGAAIGSGTRIPGTSQFTNLDISGTTNQTGALTENTDGTMQTANGAKWVRGQLSEEITLSTSGATTDSSANLLPADSIITGVVARVTQTITTATDWKVGDASTAGRFIAADATMTAGETKASTGTAWTTGIASATTGMKQASAAKVRITTTGTPGAGKIRVTIFYSAFVAPTS